MTAEGEKLDKILGEIGQINVTLGRMEQVQANFAEKIHEHGETLYGNGRAGLKQQVGDLEHDLDTQKIICEKRLSCAPPSWWKQFVFRLGVNMATLIVGGIIVAIFSLFIAQQVAAEFTKLGH